jgi:putative tryptophan/tyrosine transport system substrate-binding protein
MLLSSAVSMYRLPASSKDSSTSAAASQWTAAFVQRLRELGWIEGRTAAIQYRWAEGRTQRLAEIAAEFVKLKVDVVVTYGTPGTAAAKQATSVIPIVFASVGDPIGTGLIASLARPGGNVTGLSNQTNDLGSKRLELLRQVVPNLRRLAIMANAGNPAVMLEMAEVQGVARALGLEVVTFEIRRAEDIAPVFEALKGRVDALYIPPDAMVLSSRVSVNTMATAARLATIYGSSEYVEAGGLMPMDHTSRTCSGTPPTLSTRYCVACKPCLIASSATVSRPLSASSATLALNSAENRLRVLMVGLPHRGTYLSRLSHEVGPPHVLVRRLHDIDRTGWWVLIGPTFIGKLVLIYWACLLGTSGSNRFG